ncbi:hypothetical protein K2Z84_24715 [Candidatus Binatia bacterium]|nr:hypothetical protein [Candidatus Binatia bacterium]
MDVSPERIRRIVALAARAPSGENCQPFRFHWDGAWLTVSHDAARSRHVLNFENRASYLTLGCYLESIVIAAASEGLDARIELELADTAARVAFVARAQGPCGDASLLLDRCTDRRRYRGGPIDAPLLREIEDDLRAFPNVTIRLVAPNDELVDYVAHMERLQWCTEPIHRGHTRYFRLSNRAASRTRDGMSRASLNVGPATAALLALARRDFRVQRTLNQFGFLRIFAKRVRAWVRSAAALGCVTVDTTDPAGHVSAGRATLRTWVTLNRDGYAVQPLSICSYMVFNRDVGRYPGELPAAFREGGAWGADVLQRNYDLPPSEHVAWFFRTGRAPLRPMAGRTLRLPLERVLTEVAPLDEPEVAHAV